ncbi:hypothetical protein [Methanothrix sp.]|uniref:hypothetical protein n=1 Tax=Methanothrix sp. TaxID=90426 RepID=UPI001BD570D9
MNIHPLVYLALIAALLSSPAGASCGTWIIRGNTEYHYDAEYERAVISSTGHSAALNSNGEEGATKPNNPPDGDASRTEGASNESAKASKEEAAPVKAAKEAVAKEDPVVDLKGDWKVFLDAVIDGQNRQDILDLILIQTKDRLQGYGNIHQKGINIPVTATGRIASNDSISLNVKQVEENKDYRLDLALAGERMEGSYKIYQDGTQAGGGNITASRSEL